MKQKLCAKFIFLLLLLVFSKIGAAQTSLPKDEVVFFMSKPTVKNGLVTVEVSATANFDITALDFSLQFNQLKLRFDTIIDLTNYLEELYFYNATTKILRFTSSSLQNVEQGKALLAIRFASDSLKIDSTDLFTIHSYLNGNSSGFTVRDSSLAAAVHNARPANCIAQHLSCGDAHTLALKTNGEVWAWGGNSNGQLGNNTTTQSNAPVQVKGLLNSGFLTNATAIAAGANHSLAILCDGRIVAWGSNSNGQLGNGTRTQSLFPVLVQGLPSGLSAFSIAAGDLHSIAVMENGSVWTWGGNSNGQLGNNSTSEALTAVQVHGIGNVGFLGKAFEAAAGATHSLVLLRDSTLCAFGNATNGQTGSGVFGGKDSLPHLVLDNASNTFLNKVIGIDGGADHSIAVLANGTVKTWGGNASGQLGDGSAISKAKAMTVQGLGAAKSVAAGFGFSAVVLMDSSIWTWGANAKGQLGDNTTGSNRLSALQMHGIQNVVFLQNALAVAAGKDFCAAILNDNVNGVYCGSGNNLNGQLGDNSFISSAVPVNIYGLLVVGLVNADFSPLNGTAVCFPSGTVTFNSLSGAGGNKSFAWNFGAMATPQTSSAAGSIAVTYASAGLKSVRLIVSDGPSCYGLWTDTVLQTVNVVAGADATFTLSGPGCAGNGINVYSAGSKGTGVTHQWTFGLGSTPSVSTDENPADFIYANAGAYTITHKVFVPSCSVNDSKSQTITVNPSPVAAFTSSGSVCANVPVTFSFSGTKIVGQTFFWDFGADATAETSNAQTPTAVIYKTSGTKTVLLDVKNNFGCVTSISDSLLIKATPRIDLASTTLGPKCAGAAMAFINSGDSTGVSFKWNFGADAKPLISNVKNPSAIVYASGGTKTITLAAKNFLSGCSASAQMEAVVSELQANAGADVALCRKDEIQIGAPSIAGQAYRWMPSAGLSDSTAANPAASPDSTTEYTLTVSGYGCAPLSKKVQVLVHTLPSVFEIKNDTIAKGEKLQLQAGGGVQYVWSPSAGLSNAGISNPFASPDATTTYTVVATTIFGCSASGAKTVVVKTHDYWLPKAFTPNGNGKNDVLFVRGEEIQDFEFAIFNNMGEAIFLSKNIQTGWDGRKQNSGEEMPQGAYVFFVRGSKMDGSIINDKGLVNLIR